MLGIIGTKVPKSIGTPGWADFIGLQSTGNNRDETDTYALKMPRGFRRVMVLAIGVGGPSQYRSTWGAGGGGGGAAKAGYILSDGDILLVTVPRAAANLGADDTSIERYVGPAAVIRSTRRGELLRATAGAAGALRTAGNGVLTLPGDFTVQNGGVYLGGMGLQYTGGYDGLSAGVGGGYAGGGGAGGHGNNGGLHGPLQYAPAFVQSLANARLKYGAATFNKTDRGSNSWSGGLVNDPSFGGGSGGHSAGGTPSIPGRAMVRIVWGLTNDGGTIDPTNHGW